MLSSIKLRRDIIANEAFSISSLADLVRKVIPQMISEFKGLTSLIQPNAPAIKLSSEHKDFLKEIQKHNYLDINLLTIYVPESMDASYSDYADALLKSVSQVETLITEMSNYTTFISKLLTNADDATSTNYAKTKYQELTNELQSVKEATATCFKKNSTITEKKLKDLLHNNSEWKVVLEKLTTIITRIDNIKSTVVLSKMNECVELLTLIENKIKRKELDNISPEMISKIADYTYIVASNLEFYSVTRFRVLTYTEAINSSIDKIIKIITRD